MRITFDILLMLLKNDKYIDKIFFKEDIIPPVDEIICEDEKIECFLKGYAYENGIKTGQNNKKAIECYEKSFNLGYEQAKYKIGMIQVKEKHLSLAMKSFKEINDNKYAQYQIALILIQSDSSKKIAKGYDIMEKLSNQNFIDAMLFMGEFYLSVSKKRRNDWKTYYDKAITLFNSASKLGSGKAYYILSKYKENDIKNIFDKEKKSECLNETCVGYWTAYKKGYLSPMDEYIDFFKKYKVKDALCQLESTYSEYNDNPSINLNVGNRLVKEGKILEANEYFLKAYNKDKELSYDIFSSYKDVYSDFLNSDETDRDVSIEEFEKLLYFWAREKTLSTGLGSYEYSEFLEVGIGIEKDINKANEILKEYAIKGDLECQKNYVLFPIKYSKKENIEKDIFEASKNLALEGIQLGFCALSYCYKYGIGTKANEEKCEYWKENADMSFDFLYIESTDDDSIEYTENESEQLKKLRIVLELCAKYYI